MMVCSPHPQGLFNSLPRFAIVGALTSPKSITILLLLIYKLISQILRIILPNYCKSNRIILSGSLLSSCCNIEIHV